MARPRKPTESVETDKPEEPEVEPETLTVTQAANRLKRSRRQVYRFIETGDLKTAQVGAVRLPLVESVEALKESMQTVDQLDSEDIGAAAVIRAYADREQVLLEHERKLVEIVLKNNTEIASVLRDENVNLRKAQTELFIQAQQGLNQQQEREMAQMAFAAKEQRIDQGLQLVQQIAKAVVAQVRTSGEVAKFVRELPPNLVEQMSGLLSPDLFDMLLQLRGQTGSKDPGPNNGKMDPTNPSNQGKGN